jgi:hypothetical protein
MPSLKKWPFAGEIVSDVGDVNAPEYDGGWVLRTEHGYVLEYVETPSDDDMRGGSYSPNARWLVYRLDLDIGVPRWGHIEDVASSSGASEGELKKDFESSDPKRRANAYMDWAGHYGWREFDSYPLSLTKQETEKRYGRRIG